MAKSKVKSEAIIDNDLSEPTILGTYEGECADAEITNNNGLDIKRETWEHVFDSDDYRQGIDKGWFIGYLGHPEDPGCMDFKDACIVMTEGHIEDNGKVYGKFNLINTPVGRIVKTFQDAGVEFGISVRGAGDIINNEVDPESFVFRGFDLVAFPAYPESIPTFTAIAASTDINEKKKFEKICASVKSELENISSTEALAEIQTQFPEQSEIYNDIETRKCELEECGTDEIADEIDLSDRVNLLQAQVDGLVDMLNSIIEERNALDTQLTDCSNKYNSEYLLMSKKLHVMNRIVCAQNRDIDELEDEFAHQLSKTSNKNKILSSTNAKLKSQIDSMEHKLSVMSSKNLNYDSKINSYKEDLKAKDEVICGLKADLDKTVIDNSESSREVLNLKAENKQLRQAIKSSEQVIAEYQDAYASVYSNTLGVNLEDNISVTAATTVGELQNAIVASSNVSSIARGFSVPTEIDIDDMNDGDLVIC